MFCKKCLFLASISTISLCTGCTSISSLDQMDTPQGWMHSGSISIAGTLPEATSLTPQSMLGFMPSMVGSEKTWLSIDTQNKTVSLMNGNVTIKSIDSDFANNIPAGCYELLLKQHDALWHATDEYFINRKMEIPDSGDRSRFLRGALGDSVLYFGEELAIHNAEAATPEVGGIRLSDKEMHFLYDQLEVGAKIIVK